MGFDISNGLSLMGSTIATQAGNEALEMQKAGLENEKLVLADKLATTRESKGRQEQAGIESAGRIQQEGLTELSNKQLSDLNVTAHGKELDQDTQAAVSKLQKLSAPDMIKAQHAIAMATLGPVDLSVQVKDDGTAMTFDPRTGKATPMVDPTTGQPLKFQNAAAMQAVTQSINALKDEARDIATPYHTELVAAQTVYKASPTPENLAAINDIKKEYQPKLDSVNGRLNSLADALSVKSGVGAGGAPANAAPLSSIIPGSSGSVMPAPVTGAPAAKPASIPNASNLSLLGHY